MATFYKFDSFVEALAEKQHDLSTDTIRIALCAAASAPVATNTQLSNLTTISPYTYLTSDGTTTREIDISASSQTSGVYSCVADDLTITASGGAIAAFRYIVIYNDTATNDLLIGWYDYGVDLVLSDTETLLIDFSATGIFTIT